MVTNQKMAKLLLNLFDKISGARGVLLGMEDDPDSSQIIEQLTDAKKMIKDFIKENLIHSEADDDEEDDDDEEEDDEEGYDYVGDARFVRQVMKDEENKKNNSDYFIRITDANGSRVVRKQS